VEITGDVGLGERRFNSTKFVLKDVQGVVYGAHEKW
jgi:hypothetical protein